MEDTKNELEQVKKTVRIINSSTIALDYFLMMGRTTKGHEGLGFKEERLEAPHKCSYNKQKLSSQRWYEESFIKKIKT